MSIDNNLDNTKKDKTAATIICFLLGEISFVSVPISNVVHAQREVLYPYLCTVGDNAQKYN